MTNSTVPNEFLRPEEEIPFRKQRRELYKTLRAENLIAVKRRSKKSSQIIDDFFGGLDEDFDEKGSLNSKYMKGGNNAYLKNIKSCYQKLATVNHENVSSILNMIEEVCLSRFMQETVSNLISAPIEFHDIPSFVHVASVLFQKYKGFLEPFTQELIREITETGPKRKRILLCAYIDLLIVKLLDNAAFLYKTITDFINSDISTHDYANYPYIWRMITYAGGDLFGVNRGDNSLIDAIFPPNECVAPNLRKLLSNLFNDMVSQLELTAKDGMKAQDEAYQLLIQHGRINTRPHSLAKERREKYDKILKMLHGFAFMMKKNVEDCWIEEEGTIEFTTPGGVVTVPERYAELVKKHAQKTTASSSDSFYSVLANMDEQLTEKLSYTVLQIKPQVDKCTEIEQLDTLSKYYISINNQENLEILINEFSTISRVRINQASYYARFVANVSLVIPEFGEKVSSNLGTAFINYSYAQNNTTKIFKPKLHIALYIAELAKFKVGIDTYFKCLSFTLNERNFRGKAIDMACTLIYNSGKFLYELSDSTHSQMCSIVQTLKKLRDTVVFQPYVLLLVNKSIEMFEPTEKSISSSQPMYNKYQAYAINLLQQLSCKQNLTKSQTKAFEKLWQNSNVTHVDQMFVIQQILNVQSYSASQYSALSNFVFNISKSYPEFGITISDILLERIHRGIEIDNTLFRQKQLLEIRFLGNLIISQVIPLYIAFQTIQLILSLDQPNPSNSLIKINNKFKYIKPQPSDFFKVKLVCALLETLVKYIKKEVISSIRSDNSIIPKLLKQSFLHLQIFCLIRMPIPFTTADDISDLLDLYEKLYNYNLPYSNQIERIESLDFARSEMQKCELNDFITYSPYAFSAPQKTLNISYTFSDSDDEEVEDEDEDENLEYDPGEKDFLRELNDYKEELNSGVRKTQTKNIVIPIELLTKTPVQQIAPSERMTKNGPPKNFTICVHKNGNKQETITFK